MNISFIKIFKVVNVSKKIQLAKFDGNDEKWSRIFYFEIPLAPLELLLPSAKIKLSRKTELAWQVSR